MRNSRRHLPPVIGLLTLLASLAVHGPAVAQPSTSVPVACRPGGSGTMEIGVVSPVQVDRSPGIPFSVSGRVEFASAPATRGLGGLFDGIVTVSLRALPVPPGYWEDPSTFRPSYAAAAGVTAASLEEIRRVHDWESLSRQYGWVDPAAMTGTIHRARVLVEYQLTGDGASLQIAGPAQSFPFTRPGLSAAYGEYELVVERFETEFGGGITCEPSLSPDGAGVPGAVVALFPTTDLLHASRMLAISEAAEAEEAQDRRVLLLIALFVVVAVLLGVLHWAFTSRRATRRERSTTSTDPPHGGSTPG